MSLIDPPPNWGKTTVDFVAIEAVRVFYPAIYAFIEESREYFTGSIDYFSQTQEENFKSFHQKWMERFTREYSDSELVPLRNLLVRLFPKLTNVESAGHITHVRLLDNWRKRFLICSPEIFDTYFLLKVPDGRLSNWRMLSILENTDDVETFSQNLSELATRKFANNKSHIKAFLEQLRDMLDEIPDKMISPIVEGLFLSGDELIIPEDERPFVPFDDNATAVEKIVVRLLIRFDEPKRYEVLNRALMRSESISLSVNIIGWLGSQHGKYDAKASSIEHQILDLNHVEELERLILNRIRDFSIKSTFLQVQNFRMILAYWKDWGGDEEVIAWVTKNTQTDAQLVEFLQNFLGKSHRQSIEDRVPTSSDALNLKSLEQYVSLDETFLRLQKIAETNTPEDHWLTYEQSLAIKLFLEQYMQLQSGDQSEDWPD